MYFSFKFNTHKHFSRFKSFLLLIIYIRAKERLCSGTRKRRCIPGFSTKSIESYSQKYPSPFTKSPATPINTGGARGEGLSSPFTTLHPPFTLFRCRSPLKPAAGHQWWLQLGINDGYSWASMMAKPFSIKVFSQNNVRVKGGEGRWRAEATLHLSHPQCLSGLQAKRWRVKGKKESSILRAERPMITGREGWSNRNDSPGESFLPTYRFLPGNGTKLPWQGAISCHSQAIRGIRLRKITE